MMSYTYATSFLHFLHWTNKLNGSVMRVNISKFFKSLMVALMSSIPPRMWYCFFPPIFVGRKTSSDFHLAFSDITTHTPQIRNWCEDSASCWVFLFHLCILEPNQFGDTLDPKCDGLELMLHWLPDWYKQFEWWTAVMFWVSRNYYQFRASVY